MGLLYVFILAQTPEDIIKSLSIKSLPKTQPQTTPTTVIQPTLSLKDSIIISRQMEKSEIERMYDNYRLAFVGTKGKKEKIKTTPYPSETTLINLTIKEKTTLELEQFGYNHFYWNIASYPEAGGMATDNYIIGPGDEFVLSIWGKMERVENIVVNNEGKIYITGVGLLKVAGIKYKEARERIKKAVYNEFTNVNVEVTLARMRKVNIFLTGEVYAPGNYSISPISSILSALYLGGGPTKKGSLRRIKIVKRDGTVHYVDLYVYFIRENP